MRKIEVVDYNPMWPEIFAKEHDVLRITLDSVAVAIHHIGSTSVPGLAAKPIIDILVEVTSLDAIDALNQGMEDLGYKPKGEFGIVGRRFFQKGDDMRTHHIHAFITGDQNIARHLAFRDYLRANQVIANEYAELKRSIAQNCNNDSQKYCDDKDSFVKKHENLAVKQTPN